MSEQGKKLAELPRVSTASLSERTSRSYGLHYELFEKAHVPDVVSPIHLPVDDPERLLSKQGEKDRFVARIEGGQLVGDCVVLTPDHEIIDDSAPTYAFPIKQHLDMESVSSIFPSLPDPIEVDGRVLILNSFGPWNFSTGPSIYPQVGNGRS